ncbi:hypothetical protein KS4_09110 [Poriferisphaera corsica]|uniref:Uncharacterized protein n=1 Tax=Poriferisphaera corsica TaxID=2528020 RepID=A0A517YRL4_9BACT|nr:hypothetical protein [Poriferisphaera corsica]QDU32872.1 hypothetical protein KS4_09110 [Poriferisphaera corsica]
MRVIRFFMVFLAMTVVIGVLSAVSGGLIGKSVSGDFSFEANGPRGEAVVIGGGKEGVFFEASENSDEMSYPKTRMQADDGSKVEAGSIEIQAGNARVEVSGGDVKMMSRHGKRHGSGDVAMSWGFNPLKAGVMVGGGLGIMVGLIIGLIVATIDQIVVGTRKSQSSGKRASTG